MQVCTRSYHREQAALHVADCDKLVYSTERLGMLLLASCVVLRSRCPYMFKRRKIIVSPTRREPATTKPTIQKRCDSRQLTSSRLVVSSLWNFWLPTPRKRYSISNSRRKRGDSSGFPKPSALNRVGNPATARAVPFEAYHCRLCSGAQTMFLALIWGPGQVGGGAGSA